MTSARSITWSLVADIVLVVVFAIIGRASHSEDVLPIGILTTAWPFLLGLVIGWGVTLAWRAPTAPVRTGIPVWLITVAIGMLLRYLTGQGIALAFVIVAAVFLLITLVGWRTAAAGIRAVRHRGTRTA
nr:DUF3054 domain-containing protein [Microbacterium bovistercoris]